MGDWQRLEDHRIDQADMAVLAPIPSASDRIATAANTGLLRRARSAAQWRKACCHCDGFANTPVRRRRTNQSSGLWDSASRVSRSGRRRGVEEEANAPQKEKWFQVIRFPALLTTGMHGTEHCNRQRRTFRLSAPLKLGFPRLRINASWLAAAYSLPTGTGNS